MHLIHSILLVSFPTDSSKYPKYRIRLQTDMYDTLDLLVELARRHHLNVKLNMIQQLFFYKTKYKHLFQYGAQVPNAADLNAQFPFRNRPKVFVISRESADKQAYKQYALIW